MKQFNKNRLLKLADFLENIPPKAFNLESWIAPKNEDVCSHDYQKAVDRVAQNSLICDAHQTLKSNVSPEALHSCGFAACAMGWAGTIPEFRKAGLRTDVYNDITYRGASGFYAAEDFFGLKYSDAKFLFHPNSYENGKRTQPKTVAKRIREVVAEN